MAQMKIAKCDEEDFNYCWALRLVEDLVDGRFFMDSLNDWMDWEDGEDKERFQKAYNTIKATDACDEDEDIDPRLVIYQYIKNIFRANPSGLSRVIMAASAACDNFYDPDKDYLEYRPDIDKGLCYYNEHKKEVDEWYEKNVEPDEELECRSYIVGKSYLKDNGFSTEDENVFTLNNDECTVVITLDAATIEATNKATTASIKETKAKEHYFGDEMKATIRIRDIRQAIKRIGCEETLKKLSLKL